MVERSCNGRSESTSSQFRIVRQCRRGACLCHDHSGDHLSLVEPYNKKQFVRFHAWQCIFLFIACIVVEIILGMIPIVGWIILPFFGLGVRVLVTSSSSRPLKDRSWYSL